MSRRLDQSEWWIYWAHFDNSRDKIPILPIFPHLRDALLEAKYLSCPVVVWVTSSQQQRNLTLNGWPFDITTQHDYVYTVTFLHKISDIAFLSLRNSFNFFHFSMVLQPEEYIGTWETSLMDVGTIKFTFLAYSVVRRMWTMERFDPVW